MATPALGASEFLLGYCHSCERRVLTHVQLDPHDAELRLCLHCDTPIVDDLGSVPAADLEASGYALVEARTCGNGGGCAAGGCGMRQGS
ncbi:MAG: hypothetical protein ACHQ4J_11190 [Candidatus Binatia bacterium]